MLTRLDICLLGCSRGAWTAEAFSTPCAMNMDCMQEGSDLWDRHVWQLFLLRLPAPA